MVVLSTLNRPVIRPLFLPSMSLLSSNIFANFSRPCTSVRLQPRKVLDANPVKAMVMVEPMRHGRLGCEEELLVDIGCYGHHIYRGVVKS
jgi:hypothetical protein